MAAGLPTLPSDAPTWTTRTEQETRYGATADPHEPRPHPGGLARRSGSAYAVEPAA